jgi:hypothetical protein
MSWYFGAHGVFSRSGPIAALGAIRNYKLEPTSVELLVGAMCLYNYSSTARYGSISHIHYLMFALKLFGGFEPSTLGL